MTSGYGITGVSLTAPDSPRNVAIGSLYTDKVNCKSRPSALAFYYKYIPYKETDSPIIKINIYNNNTIIGNAQLVSSSYDKKYQAEKCKLVIDYHNNFRVEATHYEIMFESGTNKDVYMRKDSDKDDEMPMFIGSELFIDEVELIYE